MARSRADIVLYDSLIESYRTAGLFPSKGRFVLITSIAERLTISFGAVPFARAFAIVGEKIAASHLVATFVKPDEQKLIGDLWRLFRNFDVRYAG